MTTGILETRFKCKGEDFVVCDVGGQKSERRKWITCFDDVDAVIYLVSSVDYDVSVQDGDQNANVNCFMDSLQQWKVVTSLPAFSKTPFIVFWNKSDLLSQKLKISPLERLFPDYENFLQGRGKISEDSLEKRCTDFFESKFRDHFGGGGLCEFYVTCALDMKVCNEVFEVIVTNLLNSAISALGLGSGGAKMEKLDKLDKLDW
eukprot:TRINITY_DN6407_c0_g1_i13.p1 TRINITY_DN6407_c0_g1~~TRINITY_DN6407_c0_g1_i13.p1  ORF type:complete len:204 (+),score=48.39 TRINITY_DN6407_c0_g1_i13:652-1263(+)